MSSLVALLLAIAGSAGALLLPVYQVNVTRTVGRINVSEQYRERMIDSRSATQAVVVCSLCIALSAVGVVARKLQTAAGIALLTLSLLGMMTIGMFLPAVGVGVTVSRHSAC